MINQLLNFTLSLIMILFIAILLYFIWFIFWNIVLLPIRKKDEIKSERDEARQELKTIQAQKGVEWESYKDLKDEFDKMRKSYFSLKEDTQKLKEEKAKLQSDKDNLISYNKELKKKAKPS